MTVYAVMRGKEFHGLYATESVAQQVADKRNEMFPRGTRYRAVAIEVRESAESC